PADVTPFALVVIGRPAKPAVGKVDRFDPKKIHRNVW
ncbi:MAG: nitroreductase family protein, partial [Spirochaetaceae bacterium]